MGILDGVVAWIAEQVMNILDLISGFVLGASDMTTFIRYFPAAESFYDVMVAIGIGFALLNLVFQLFKNFGFIAGIEGEDPIKLTIRTCLFLFIIYFSRPMIDIVLDIGGTPYNWILDAQMPPISFADFNSVLLVIIGALANGSVVLIALILLLVLAWNYLKLLFEAGERYVLLGVMVFTAPVPIAMGASQATANIFRSWCRMLGGQIFLLLMNAWCLRLFTNMFGNFIANPLAL